MNPTVKAFFHEPTFTVSYVVSARESGECIIIDSVFDYNNKSGRTSTISADEIVTYIQSQKLSAAWILETHVHADHLTAASYLQEQLGGTIGIGDHVGAVQTVFKKIFNFGDEMKTDSSQFQRLFEDGDQVDVGELQLEIIFTPGHTPACVTYKIGDAVFVGDTLFMPDYGSARCDFPGGDARQLYRPIRKILSFPAQTRLLMCHDYGPDGREFAGRRQSKSSAPEIYISMMKWTKRLLSNCGKGGMQTFPCPSLSSQRFRSICGQAPFRQPRITAFPT